MQKVDGCSSPDLVPAIPRSTIASRFRLLRSGDAVLFNSITFLLFFVAVAVLHYVLPHRWRWALILAASYFFYGYWSFTYLLFLVSFTVANYLGGILVDRSSDARTRNAWLFAVLSLDLGLLIVFKYLSFLLHSLKQLLDEFSVPGSIPVVKIMLPLGISFCTFQTMSYIIDVYRRKLPSEKHFGVFSAYVSFFPTIAAGPIERGAHLMPQLREKHQFDYGKVTNGLKLMVWGLFKKVVIADRLAVYVDTVYSSPSNYAGFPMVLASYFFVLQLYSDFSGYTDIARGAAQVLGFNLMENFRHPLFSRSIPDFWRAWHISLSTWFHDYLYVPLAMSTRNPGRTTVYWTAFVVFLLCGIWHGANWTFVVFGALHGGYIVVSLATRKWRRRLGAVVYRENAVAKDVVQMLITFHLVWFAFIFFRAASIGEAWFVITQVFSNAVAVLRGLAGWNLELIIQRFRGLHAGLNTTQFLIAAGSVMFLIAVEALEHKRGDHLFGIVSRQPLWVRWCLYNALVIAILLLGVFGEQKFVYFKF